ncbi:MAG: hypothetical protein U0271_33870 [Polyangiaceae bacterium]
MTRGSRGSGRLRAIEEPLLREGLATLLERLEQRAAARGAHVVDDELHPAARRPERDPPEHDHARAVGHELARAHRPRAIEHGVDRCVFLLVAQREIGVPALDGARGRDLAVDLDRARRALEGLPQQAAELRDGERLGGFDHGLARRGSLAGFARRGALSSLRARREVVHTLACFAKS